MERTRRLLRERIIREITPIFDTTALGYSSMLVAARVDAEHPQRAAAVINEHPGVSHNYLRNHDFNLWFTIATAPDSKLGLDGTLDVLKELTGAESIRKLPTLTMFKINMNLEMEGGTAQLAAPVEAVEPRPRDPVPFDDFDVAVIRALQGPMDVRPDAYAPAAAQLGVPVERMLAHLEGMIERKLLRRVAAILFHRRAGFSANGMGVWKVPEDQIAEIGPADGGRARRVALLPAPDLPRLAVQRLHDGARALEGGVRCGPRRRRRRVRARRRRSRDAVLVDGVQEGSPALLHSRLRGVGETNSGRIARQTAAGTRSHAAVRTCQGGHSGRSEQPGAGDGLGRPRATLHRSGAGAEIEDVDGNRYIDYVCSWGPLILGHAHPAVVEAVSAAARRGTSFGAPTEAEVELAAEVVDRVPSAEMVRLVSSGTEASMTAVRLARAATGRDKIVKFAGHYHGHVDGLLAESGSGLATQGIPASPGRHGAQAADTIVVPWNDADALAAAVDVNGLAASLPSRCRRTWGWFLRERDSCSCCAMHAARAVRCSCSTRSSAASASGAAARRSSSV